MRDNTWARQTIELNSVKYKTRDEFFKDVSKLLDILTKVGYECVFRYDDADVYVLEYDFDDPAMGTPMIHWLDEEQVDCLYTSNYIGENENTEE